LYLIDRDGKVAFKSRPGPFGFKPDQLEAAIKKLNQVEAAK
jgi:type I thyroxine 5'-deiodinase